MEAAWEGDIGKIKSLTLQPWGKEQDHPPLMADIVDNRNNSPFSLAFLRGHYATAKAILDIVQTQWTPRQEDEVRYKIEGDEEDDDDECGYSDEDSDAASSDADVRIVSEKVDKTFTIDNIGQVSLQVKSHRKPTELLTTGFRSFTFDNDTFNLGGHRITLFSHVIREDDMTGLKALLEMAEKFSEAPKADDDERKYTFTFSDADFIEAVKSGNTQAIRYIIKKTGAGMPLDSLVKKSGAAVKKKPRYYQGLTVYGKKRYDVVYCVFVGLILTSAVQK